MEKVEVAIVGAGPYGLSLAAHLEAKGVSYQIFGIPMFAWGNFMPHGMQLKSEGHSSSLYAPQPYTIDEYCIAQGLPFKREGWPIPVEVFVSYGQEFQKRKVQRIEASQVTEVCKSGDEFVVKASSGTQVTAKKVVLASGIAPFAYTPDSLQGIKNITHAAEHADLTGFKGKKVVVVGAGASAIDLAVLLFEAGAHAELVTRSSEVRFLSKPIDQEKTLYEKLRYPESCMPGFKGLAMEHFPNLFKNMAQPKRAGIVKSFVGPAGGWYMKETFHQNVPHRLNQEVLQATESGGTVTLTLKGADGKEEKLTADHVIAGTGYRIDIKRWTYLCPETLAKIADEFGAPVLTQNFETSVPNLFVMGSATAPQFGPVMRFACGAKYTAAKIAARVS